jgi:hypothetical protein
MGLLKSYLILLIQLLTFCTLGQYDLNFKFGYVNPIFEKLYPYKDYYDTVYLTEFNQASRGLSADIGLQKKVNDFYQHKLVVTGLIRHHNVKYSEITTINNINNRHYDESFYNVQLSYFGIFNVLRDAKIPLSFTAGLSHDRSILYRINYDTGQSTTKRSLYSRDINLYYGVGLLYQKKFSDKVSVFGEILVQNKIFSTHRDVTDFRFSVGINHRFNNRTRAIKDTLKLMNLKEFNASPISSSKEILLHREKANFRNYYLFGLRVFRYWQNPNTYRPISKVWLYPYEQWGLGGGPEGHLINRFVSTSITSELNGFGADLYFDRFHFSYFHAQENIDYKITKAYIKTYLYYPSSGYRTRYFEEYQNYFGHMTRSSKTIGIGFNLMGAGRRLKIIPTYQWQKNDLIKNNVTLSEHRKHYYDKYQYYISSGYEEWDSLMGPSSFVDVRDSYRSRRYGFTIALKVFYGLEIQYTHLRQFDETPLFNYDEVGRTVVSSYFHQLGISYNLQIEKTPRKKKLMNRVLD